jgi:S-adenosylmethionine-diacylglycerol 3-amino-3-carboxypropyl transferase
MTTKQYFSDLNYSLGNEDTGFEVELLKILKPKKVLSIAGCGSRLWPLGAHGAEQVIGIDVAPQQIFISELRLEGIKTFSHEEYLKFWGFPPFGAYDYSHERRELFGRLKLSTECRDYFHSYLERINWGPLLYEGKWEKTFALLSKVVRLVLGKDYDGLFQHHELSEQVSYYESSFPLKKWKSVLYILGNKAVFDALLYKGDFIKKNVPESHFEYYFQNYERLFTQVVARSSFFAHLCFYGKLNHSDGNTVEAHKDVFERMKAVYNDGAKAELKKLDLLSAANEHQGAQLDFLSLSDVPSYFSGDLEQNFMQELRGTLSDNGVVVVRSYLREPEANLDGYADITPRFGELIAREGVQMYRIKVYQKA